MARDGCPPRKSAAHPLSFPLPPAPSLPTYASLHSHITSFDFNITTAHRPRVGSNTPGSNSTPPDSQPPPRAPPPPTSTTVPPYYPKPQNSLPPRLQPSPCASLQDSALRKPPPVAQQQPESYVKLAPPTPTMTTTTLRWAGIVATGEQGDT